jgi:DNA-binding XRE family transcriptional regulator
MGRQRLPSLNERIRTKRSQLGLTGAELAQRADISPSYVSLIEKGAKVPDEDVAARIARALRDDEDLYRAWARASRLGVHKLDLLTRMGAISRSPAYLSLVERGGTLPEGPLEGTEAEDIRKHARESPRQAGGSEHWSVDDMAGSGAHSEHEEGSAAALEASEPAAETGILRIPVLAEGADPGKIAPSPIAVQDRLLVDRRLVADYSPERLFAYDVTLPAMKHLRGVASPGDRIVFQRGGRVNSDRVCVVRTPGGIVLSRVLFKGRSLLLLPGDGERDFESVEVEGLKALPGIIAGTHVLLIRR